MEATQIAIERSQQYTQGAELVIERAKIHCLAEKSAETGAHGGILSGWNAGTRSADRAAA